MFNLERGGIINPPGQRPNARPARGGGRPVAATGTGGLQVRAWEEPARLQDGDARVPPFLGCFLFKSSPVQCPFTIQAKTSQSH